MKCGKNKTNTIAVFAILILFISILPPSGQLYAQEKNRMRVRVFDGETPVKDLAKDDFLLLKGKKILSISRVDFDSKRLEPASVNPKESRTIVLEFHLFHFDQSLRETLKAFFDRVIAPGDRLRVFVHDAELEFNPVSYKETVYREVTAVVEAEVKKERLRMEAELVKIARFADDIRKKAKRDVDAKLDVGWGKGLHPHYYMKFLKFSLEKYVDMLTRYKNKYVLPQIRRYHRLAGELARVKGRKWWISFYRMPLLPRFTGRNRRMINDWMKELSKREWLDEMDYTRKLERLQGEIDHAFDTSDKFSGLLFHEMARQFYRGGVTFHAVYASNPAPLKAENGTAPTGDVIKETKTRFRRTAFRTGGQLSGPSASNLDWDKITRMDSGGFVLQSKDIKQRTAVPLELEIKGKKYSVFYDDRTDSTFLKNRLAQKTAQIPSVRLENISFKSKTLSAAITGFYFRPSNSKKSPKGGKLNIHILILNSKGKTVFNQAKDMAAQKEKITLRIRFPKLIAGDYRIALRVKDLNTGKMTRSTFAARTD